jgi:hypothetical protein
VPRIQWTNLPPALRDHLFDRLRDRKITVEDLYQLKVWRESEPDAPEGPWLKDFGSFKVCGEGRFPKTFLIRGQAAKGQKLLRRARPRNGTVIAKICVEARHARL